ncbi:hypothetical protein ACLOAV_004566 [Pseudogymnoascus australis]
MTAAINFTVSAVSLLPEKWFIGGEKEDQAKFSKQPDWPLPKYTVLVPVYRESEVMPELIKAMKRLDYPSEKLEIMFLVEEHDQETREAALSAGLCPNMRIVDLPPGNPQTKPRSCNLGLLLARGDLIVIFDAEDRPDPDQLIKAAKAFAGAKDNRLACVQAKLFFYNAKQNILTHQFALEYALRYGMILPGLTRLGLPIPLGGTSNHFRTDILRRLGGWDAWNVTEDADLGMRCQALGYRVNMIESITWEEATSQPGAWIKQRTRWLKGFMITVLVHTRHPAQTLQRFRPAGMVTLFGIVLGAPLSFLGQPIALMLLLCDLAGFRWSNLGNGWHRGLTSTLLLMGTLMTMAVTLFAAFRRRISYSHLACLLPGYWALYWVAAWRALFQLVHSPFVWEKTPHGQTTHVTPKTAATSTSTVYSIKELELPPAEFSCRYRSGLTTCIVICRPKSKVVRGSPIELFTTVVLLVVLSRLWMSVWSKDSLLIVIEDYFFIEPRSAPYRGYYLYAQSRLCWIITMNAFAISSPLVLSCMLRISNEESIYVLLGENMLIVFLVEWMPSFSTTFLTVFTVFLGLAFYETRAEYMHPLANAREFNPGNSTEHTGIVTQANDDGNSPRFTTNLKTRMCPMAISRIIANTRSSIPGTKSEKDADRVHKTTNEVKKLHGKPILFPCHLRHRRLTPFKDSFQHSYLYVGTPVGLEACYSPILCVDSPYDPMRKWPFRKAWFNIRSQDHGIRGGFYLTIAEKLKEYLISDGADPAEWAYAYLLAVPSINGQVDNPLGFWYLYTADRELTAIVAELNTSFGERRMWLVRQCLEPKLEPKKIRKSPYTFRGHFGKDIHVSPFMPSNGGGYTIDTSDPCASPSNQLDILVTLTKAEGGPLLITRVASSSPGLDASAAPMWEKIAFLVRWCYVPTSTVMTYRILSQAARIYLKAPRVWTRPEPTKTALGKPARAVERTLERSFRLILKSAVENHPSPLSVTYVTPGEHSKKSEIFRSVNAQEPIQKQSDLDASSTETEKLRNLSFGKDNSPANIAFQVISPVFYSRFFHYDSPCSAFTGELLDDDRTRTVWSSDPNIFMSIFCSTVTFTGTKAITYSSVSNHWRWWLVSLLRTAPVATTFPHITPYRCFKGLSSMDHWILEHCLRSDAEEYRRAMLRIFIGEWIGGTAGPMKRFSNDLEPFGLSRDAVLRIYDATIKAFVVTMAVSLIRVLETESNMRVKGLVGWLVAGANLWACLKAYL